MSSESLPDGYGDSERSLHQEEARVRSKMSNERTFAAWIRTAVSVTVVGLAVAHFLAQQEGWEWWFLSIGGGYVAVGAVLSVWAAYHYFNARKLMKRASFNAPRAFLVVIALLVAVLSLGLLAGLVLTIA